MIKDVGTAYNNIGLLNQRQSVQPGLQSLYNRYIQGNQNRGPTINELLELPNLCSRSNVLGAGANNSHSSFHKTHLKIIILYISYLI